MENSFFDLIILGAGPAGLTAAQYGARSNLSVLVIENGAAGGQALNINNLENYPGIFPGISGAAYTEVMKKQAEAFGAKFVTATISSIDKVGNKFMLASEDAEFSSYAVIFATGAEHRKLGVPGEKEFTGAGVSYCAACDGPFFKNRKIVVIGGGDSACDEATYLSTLSDDVTLVHRRGQLRAQKAVAERVLGNEKIKVIFNTVVKEIRGNGRVQSLLLENTETKETSEIAADGVFVFAGMIPRSELVEMLPKDANGYIKTNEKLETPVKGMYCAGDIRSKPFRQVVTAEADGAVAAYSAGQYIRELKNDVYQ